MLAQLFDLVWTGHVSNDQFTVLRHFKMGKGRLDPKRGSGTGRWYATSPLPRAEADESAVTWVHHLLKSQGSITRDVVNAYAPYLWESMQQVLRRLEELGTLSRGLFVQGVPTLQFMERDTVTAIRKPPSKSIHKDAIIINTADPVNMYGNTVPWPDVTDVNFARKPGHFLLIHHGQWVGWLESYGRKMVFFEEGVVNHLDVQWLVPVFRQLMAYGRLKKLVIHMWNGEKVVQSAAGKSLLAYGAERDRDTLVFWPSVLNG